MITRAVVELVWIVFAASSLHAQPVTLLVKSGDYVTGPQGTFRIEQVRHIAVNSRGDWAVHAVHGSGPGSLDLVIHNGVLVAAANDPMPWPPTGSTFLACGALALSDDGALWMSSILDSPWGYLFALFRDDVPFVSSWDFLQAPGAPAGLRYANANRISIGSGNRHVAIACSFSGTGYGLGAVVAFEMDSQGQRLSERLLVLDGDLLPGTGRPVAYPAHSGPEIDRFGTVLHEQGPHSGSPDVLFLEQAVVAQEGPVSVVPGTWITQLNAEHDLCNGHVVYAFQERIGTTTNWAIVLDGTPFALSGQILPGLPYPIVETLGKPRTDAYGNVAWIGTTGSPGPGYETALFRNHTPLLREGEVVGGALVETLEAGHSLSQVLDISPNGRYIIVASDDDDDAVFLIDHPIQTCDCGDCNVDGVTDTILDALTASQIAVGIVIPSGRQALCCDTNALPAASPVIDIIDALLIAQAATGIPVLLTCP